MGSRTETEAMQTSPQAHGSANDKMGAGDDAIVPETFGEAVLRLCLPLLSLKTWIEHGSKGQELIKGWSTEMAVKGMWQQRKWTWK